MPPPSLQPKLFHITHIANLPAILRAGVLWSDLKRIELGFECSLIGMSSIKQRRLGLPVKCHEGTTVGDYVPFYFCPRSIMLFLLHKGNHLDLTYHGGQSPIVHLTSDLAKTVAWATSQRRPWAFTDANAGSSYATFYNTLADLDKVNWSAVADNDFRDPMVKEGKQAEFLIYESFPWELVERIGVQNKATKAEAVEALREAGSHITVNIERTWYY